MLRRVQDHLCDVHLTLGAVQESLGLVDVIYHRTSALPALNYVTPRQKTSWIPGHQVELGLNRLSELQRSHRVQYIEGLFPPPFAQTLRELGLKPEIETPLMVYVTDGPTPAAPLPQMPTAPDSVTITLIHDQRGVAIWWYVYRNALYEVVSTGVDPFQIGWDMMAMAEGVQLNVLAYHNNFPVGVVRVTVQETSAHIAAIAQVKESAAAAPQIRRLMLLTAIKAVLERGCTLVFGAGESEDERKLYRELGFVDSGSIVCYAADSQTAPPADQASAAKTANTTPTTQEDAKTDGSALAESLLPLG